MNFLSHWHKHIETNMMLELEQPAIPTIEDCEEPGGFDIPSNKIPQLDK